MDFLEKLCMGIGNGEGPIPAEDFTVEEWQSPLLLFQRMVLTEMSCLCLLILPLYKESC